MHLLYMFHFCIFHVYGLPLCNFCSMNIIYVIQLCYGFQLHVMNTIVYSCVMSNGYAISILLSLLCLMVYNAIDGRYFSYLTWSATTETPLCSCGDRHMVLYMATINHNNGRWEMVLSMPFTLCI